MHAAARFTLVAALVSACAVTPALAASKPKRGTYIDSKTQTSLKVGAKRTSIASFQTQCVVALTTGTGTTLGGMLVLPARRRIAVTRNGRFTFAGTMTQLYGDDELAVTVRLAGRFVKGRATGTLTVDATTSNCLQTTFTAGYYGVNPAG